MKYADDTSLIFKLKPNDANSEIHSIFHEIQVRSEEAKLKLNKNKSKLIIFNKKRHQKQRQIPEVQRVSSPNLLGVTITEDLSWSEHINKVIKRCTSRNFLPIFAHFAILPIFHIFLYCFLRLAHFRPFCPSHAQVLFAASWCYFEKNQLHKNRTSIANKIALNSSK